MGQIVRLRKFDPPLPRFVTKRNLPIKLSFELCDSTAASISAANRMITELMYYVNCETKAPMTPAEQRRHMRHARQRLADKVPAPGLEQFPVDPDDGAWHMHVWYPNQRPVTAA